MAEKFADEARHRAHMWGEAIRAVCAAEHALKLAKDRELEAREFLFDGFNLPALAEAAQAERGGA
jgi:hypothetical protein